MTLFHAVADIEIPKAMRTGGGPKGDRKYPFNTMEVGESFFVPKKTTDNQYITDLDTAKLFGKNTLSTHASLTGKRLGKKFKTLLVWGHEVEYEDGSLGWTTAHEPAEEGSVLGIGVWRVM